MSGAKELHDAESTILSKEAVASNAVKDCNYFPWNDYFMSLSYLIAAGSKDPIIKVGACIINEDNKVISVGYNGMFAGIDESMLSWEETHSYSYLTKNPYVVHAEMNAVMNGKHLDFERCKIFVTQFPCPECAKLIIQAGIKQVFYAEEKELTEEIIIPTTKMFKLSGVALHYFQPSVKKLKIDLCNASTTLIRTDEE